MTKKPKKISKDAVLLIPDPEDKSVSPAYGIKPGYYSATQMLDLISEFNGNSEAIQFIADMLETGDPENDGFAELLRVNKSRPDALQQIVKAASG